MASIYQINNKLIVDGKEIEIYFAKERIVHEKRILDIIDYNSLFWK